jgi:hypothetical protein
MASFFKSLLSNPPVVGSLCALLGGIITFFAQDLPIFAGASTLRHDIALEIVKSNSTMEALCPKIQFLLDHKLLRRSSAVSEEQDPIKCK